MLRHDDGLECEINFFGLKDCYLLPLFYCNTNVTEVYTLPTHTHTLTLLLSLLFLFHQQRLFKKSTLAFAIETNLL